MTLYKNKLSLLAIFISVIFTSVNRNTIFVQAQIPEQTKPPEPPTPIVTATSTTQRPPNAKQQSRPMNTDWAHSRNNGAEKVKLLAWLIDGCWKMNGEPCNDPKTTHKEYEYEGYDGFYNNLAHPELGAVDTPLLRRTPAAYEDGVYEPSGKDRPNPLRLSEKIMKQKKLGTQSQTGKTALLVFFGQQVVEEILDAQRAACPPEYFNIKIPSDHLYSLQKPNHTELPILRTRYDMRTGYSPNNPRQQLNEITPWLDGGLVYGTTKAWADHLRMYKNGTVDPHGKLATSNEGLFPEINSVRLPMANPPPPFHHSVYVRDYARNGCKLIQNLHKSNISNELKHGTIRTCNSFWRPQEFIQANISNSSIIDIDRILMGMAFQLCEKEDHEVVEDLRGRVFGPLEFSRRDLMAINIQRGRDHGLPDYNTARKAYGLKENTFEDFTKIPNDNSQKDEHKLFDEEEIKRIENLGIYDIILSVTQMDHNDIQENPFSAPSKDNSCFVGILVLLAKQKKRQHLQKALRIEMRVRESFRKGDKQLFLFSVSEWIDKKSPLKPVVVVMDPGSKQIQVKNQLGHLLRVMDLSHSQLIELYIVNDGTHLMLRVSNHYDLVLKFESEYLRENFLQAFEQYINIVGITRERINVALHPLLRQAVTRRGRQKRLEMFFRVVFSQAFKISHSEDEILNLDSQAAREIIYTELTMAEFAEALSMPAESEFVRKMFVLVDKDKNGFISFREFVDMLIIFAKGSADDKAKLMFDMYDINATGQLTLEDFKNMISSLMETVSADVQQEDLETAINSMMKSAGLANKEVITVEDFQRLLSNNKGRLGIDQLNLTGIPTGQSSSAGLSIKTPGEHVPVSNELSIDNDQEMALQNRKEEPIETTFWIAVRRVIENYAREVFWCALYTLVLLAIFAERAYLEREHAGLRRIAGYGVTITRGAASAMMFTYSTLLITMCRNTITMLRDTFLHVYIPFDSAVSFHKYVALWALVFTGVTFLEFKRPNNFEYKSGQWVRIACPALNTSEYHPFTLSSAPHEKNLTVHIRAVGPWTTNIRSLYDPSILRENPLPKYICERHFQRVCDRSLLTGLKAVTHFGRPNFTQFFKSIQALHPKVRKVGVFSCGPPPLTQIVDKACVGLNKETYNGPVFQHHFKNF
ncbi:hypothetical protein C0J52_05201 [Blattella germanica]|nr:hypothetical protein C0J52_05201 [Blattella germanica]